MKLKQYIAKTIRNFLKEQFHNDNFAKWFGNSKVVDQSGHPMICYHGTSKGGFMEFKPKTGTSGKPRQQLDLGSHFSVQKDYASGYAGEKKNSKVYECYLRIENPLYTNQLFYREDNEDLFLKYWDFTLKTFKIKAGGDYYYNKKGDKQQEPQNIMINSFLIDKISSSKLYNSLIEYGFDGVVHEPYNMEGIQHFRKHPTAYIVLKPNQVKSVENDGSWNLNNDSIYS